MHGKPVAGRKEPSVPVKFVSAGLAASVAEAVTIPIDTAKVRLQVRVARNIRVFVCHVLTFHCGTLATIHMYIDRRWYTPFLNRLPVPP